MSAYRLAVCEDDTSVLKELKRMCSEILAEEGVENEITVFPSAKALNTVLLSQSKPFDMLILDIQMEDMTGLELAQALRQRGDRVSIIFVTAYEDYLPHGYGVQPIHFLLKPVSREALCDALRTDIKLNHKPKTVALRIGHKTISLPVSEIRYIESFNHSIIIHENSKRSYTISLSEVEKQLPTGIFCRCHNSYLVNMDFVEEIGRTELTLRSGEVLPVGRAYYKSFQSAFISFINQ
ncbi:MAG: LytR/AlgR family response regulator transcription factor [Ruminococcus sp.]